MELDAERGRARKKEQARHKRPGGPFVLYLHVLILLLWIPVALVTDDHAHVANLKGSRRPRPCSPQTFWLTPNSLDAAWVLTEVPPSKQPGTACGFRSTYGANNDGEMLQGAQETEPPPLRTVFAGRCTRHGASVLRGTSADSTVRSTSVQLGDTSTVKEKVFPKTDTKEFIENAMLGHATNVKKCSGLH